jgi:phosphoglycerate dehydrogenase-like enzyme
MSKATAVGPRHKIAITGRTSPYWVAFYQSHTPPEFELVWLDMRHLPAGGIEGVLADVEFCFGTLPVEWLPLAPRLKLIQQGGVGYVDSFITAARERGVPVAITPEGTCLGVAEHTILLILAVYKHLAEAHATMRAGRWEHERFRRDSYFFYGKTLGIVGLGRIGTDVARRARGFEPRRMLYHDLFPKAPGVERELGVEFADLDTLLRESDVVTLHVFLSARSRHLIGERELGLMKPSAVLVNTSRGAVVDEQALYRALRDRRIWGAGLDAWTEEPTAPDNPILQLPNVTCTPHMATGTVDADRMKFEAAVANFRRVLAGEAPLNVVRPYEEVVAGGAASGTGPATGPGSASAR